MVSVFVYQHKGTRWMWKTYNNRLCEPCIKISCRGHSPLWGNVWQTTDKLCNILMIFQHLTNKIDCSYTSMSFFQGIQSVRLSKRNSHLKEKSIVHTTQWLMHDGQWIGRIHTSFSQYQVHEVFYQRTSSVALYRTCGKSWVESMAQCWASAERKAEYRRAPQPLIHVSFRCAFAVEKRWISSGSNMCWGNPSQGGWTHWVITHR